MPSLATCLRIFKLWRVCSSFFKEGRGIQPSWNTNPVNGMNDSHFFKGKHKLSFKISSVKVSNPTSKSLYRWWCIAMAPCRFWDFSGQGFQVTFVFDSLRIQQCGNHAGHQTCRAMAVAQFHWYVATDKMVSLCAFNKVWRPLSMEFRCICWDEKLHSQGPTSSVADPKLSQRHVNDWAPTSPSTLLSKCHQHLNLWGDGRHRASAAIVEGPKGVNCGGPTIFYMATSYIKPVFHRSAVHFCDEFLKIFWPSPSKWLKTTTHHLNSRLRSQNNKSETWVCRTMFHAVLAAAPQKLPHIMPQLWPWRTLTSAGSSPYGAMSGRSIRK